MYEKSWSTPSALVCVAAFPLASGCSLPCSVSRQFSDGHSLFFRGDVRVDLHCQFDIRMSCQQLGRFTEVIEFLHQMLFHHSRRHLVVVMDQATPHTSQLTRKFIEDQKRLHVFYLPSYSPDWNPEEKVGNHLKCQELKSHQAKSKDELKKLTHNKLQSMSKNPSLLRGIYFRCCVADFLQ